MCCTFKKWGSDDTISCTSYLVEEAETMSPTYSFYSRQPRFPVGLLMGTAFIFLRPLQCGPLTQGHSAWLGVVKGFSIGEGIAAPVMAIKVPHVACQLHPRPELGFMPVWVTKCAEFMFSLHLIHLLRVGRRTPRRCDVTARVRMISKAQK